jgi:hypothetical protein
MHTIFFSVSKALATKAANGWRSAVAFGFVARPLVSSSPRDPAMPGEGAWDPPCDGDGE